MFGLNRREVLEAVREGKELVVASSEFSADNLKGSKVYRAGVWDFLKIAKRRNRRQNPISPNQADYVNWVIYDCIAYAAGATLPNLFKLFVSPISATKTKVDTNMEQVSVLPAPQWFNCSQIAITVNPNVAPKDLDAFLDTTYMEFWVSQKVYVEGPIDCFPGGNGAFSQPFYASLLRFNPYLSDNRITPFTLPFGC